jgi:AraC family transcriptional regulator
MDVTIKQQPELRVGTVRHIGPYERIVHAFERLGAVMSGAKRPPDGQLLALYYDDPEATPPERLRSDAALTFPPGIDVPAGLIERHVPSGKYLTAIHVGSYERLGKAWADLKGEIAKRGLKPTGAVSYEVYLNDPIRVSPAELQTELFAPIE